MYHYEQKKKIISAIDYYLLNSAEATKKFILAIRNTYNSLELNPFYQVCYKSIRSIKIKKLPYSLYFLVNDEIKTVRILSCFHNKLNSSKKPKG